MELEILRWLRERLTQSSRVLVGPGDDAAILDWPAPSTLILACDTIVEGLDFTFETASPQQIGRKALAINLSDIAAMAATPVAATISFVLPRGNTLELCQRLVEGMLELAEQFAVDLVGGDISIWDGPLIITVNLAGEASPNGCWQRTGASAGDHLVVTGKLGGSILEHHLNFQPRLAESQLLRADYTINAAIDISDGLAIDTHRLATECDLQHTMVKNLYSKADVKGLRVRLGEVLQTDRQIQQTLLRSPSRSIWVFVQCLFWASKKRRSPRLLV